MVSKGGKQYLFLEPGDALPRRSRKKSLDTLIRRHVMADIGKSRRKQTTPQYDTLIWQSETPPAEDLDVRAIASSSSRCQQSRTSALSHYSAPVLDILGVTGVMSMFEKQWGEDMFSAYGFTLLMTVGRDATCSTRFPDTFWFPLAFRKSAFLNHYQQLLTRPEYLSPMCQRSAGRLRSLALQRSLETIQCVESRLASSDASIATSDDVFHAVLAMICYNFISLEFDQALLHIKGLLVLIGARNNTTSTQITGDIMQMIRWVDVTAALLNNSKPVFEPPPDMVGDESNMLSPNTLPLPVPDFVLDYTTQDVRLARILSCISDLNALAALLRSESARIGDAIWDDSERIARITNPISYQLLNLKSQSHPTDPSNLVSEALRLGSIVWLLRVKRRCRSYPGPTAQHSSRLFGLLMRRSDEKKVWSDFDLRRFRVWLLVLCGISELSGGDLVICARLLWRDMQKLGLRAWAELMTTVRQMPWLDMDNDLCTGLEQRVSSFVMIQQSS